MLGTELWVLLEKHVRLTTELFLQLKYCFLKKIFIIVVVAVVVIVTVISVCMHVRVCAKSRRGHPLPWS